MRTTRRFVPPAEPAGLPAAVFHLQGEPSSSAPSTCRSPIWTEKPVWFIGVRLVCVRAPVSDT